jgi:hypothetical protein
MKRFSLTAGNILISAIALAGTVGVSVGGATATSYLAPVQTASWNYQDNSLPNPNNVGVWGADITPDGNYIVLGENKQSRVRIIDIATGVRVRTVTVGVEPNEIDIESTGTYAWVMNAWDNTISRVTISSGAVTTPITSVCPQGARGMRNMELTPNDQFLVVSCASQWSDSGTSVQIIKLSDYSVTSVSNGANPMIRLAMSPTGNFVYASSIWGQVSGATSVTRIALPSGNIDNTFSVQTSAGSTTADGPAFLGMNSTGTTLYVASNNGVFSAWNNLGATPSNLWSTYLGHGGLGNVLGPSPFVVDQSRGLGYLIYINQGSLWPEVMDVYNMSDGTRASRITIDHQWAASLSLSDNGQTLITTGWRFSNMYKYQVGQAVTTTTTSTTTTTTTTTTTPTTTTTTVPSSTTTVGGSTTTVSPGITSPSTTVVDGGLNNNSTTTTVRVNAANTGNQATTTTSTTTSTIPPNAGSGNSTDAPDAPTVKAGEAKATINGSTADLIVQRSNNRIGVAGSGIELTVSAVDENGDQIALDTDGNLRITSTDSLVVDAKGFGPEQDIEAWLFSTPTNIGQITSDTTGRAKGTFAVPANLENGEHRLVLKSATAEGEETLIALGIVAGSENTGRSGTSIAVGLVIGLALLVGLLIPVVIRRRDPKAS